MSGQRTILLFEPRVEGHHVMWLALLIEIMVEAGHRVIIAADLNDGRTLDRLKDYEKPLILEQTFLPVYEKDGSVRGGSMLEALLLVYRQCQPDAVFVNSLDEFGSKLLRKAMFGRNPLAEISCGLSGVYHRPRFLEPERSLRNLTKQLGFARLDKRGFFKHIFLLDGDLVETEQARQRYRAQFHLVLEPAEGTFHVDKAKAREELDLPADAPVLLHYGVGAKRKGLQLLLEALGLLPAEMPFHLIAAGRQPEDAAWLEPLEKLAATGKATVLNRYISTREEELCFCASDLITLPYLSHYGAANILSKAALARRPVIASDHHLLGRRVRQQHLGVTFKDRDAVDLSVKFTQLLPRREAWEHQFDDHLAAYAEMVSVARFRETFSRVDYFA